MKVGCSFLLTLAALNLSVGTFCFGYDLYSILGLTPPLAQRLLGGLLLGQFCYPIAILCWLLRLCGLPAPFFHT